MDYYNKNELEIDSEDYDDYEDDDFEDCDYCYECSGYGDDCYVDEYGCLISNCDDCFNNPLNKYDYQDGESVE